MLLSIFRFFFWYHILENFIKNQNRIQKTKIKIIGTKYKHNKPSPNVLTEAACQKAEKIVDFRAETLTKEQKEAKQKKDFQELQKKIQMKAQQQQVIFCFVCLCMFFLICSVLKLFLKCVS